MTRKIILVALVLTMGHANAQKLFDIGLKGGVSRDNILVDNVADFNAILGWHAGLFARLKPPLAPGAQGELLFNSMGTDLRPADSIPGNASIRLRYLQVPLFLVFSLGPAEIHLGGYASHLLNSSIKQPTAVQGELQQLRDNQFRDTDYGLLGGLGLRLSRFYAGARYTMGLGTVGVSGNNWLGNARNLQAQFYVGYGFMK